MKKDGGPGLRHHGLLATPREADDPEADAMLSNALAVPLIQGGPGVLEDVPERARHAHVERLPGLSGGRNNVPRERLSGGRGALGQDVQFCTVV